MSSDIETNFSTINDPALRAAGQALLDAAMAYWVEYQRACGSAAVVWLSDTDDRLLIFTRFEYRHQLLQNIQGLRRGEERITAFDE